MAFVQTVGKVSPMRSPTPRGLPRLSFRLNGMDGTAPRRPGVIRPTARAFHMRGLGDLGKAMAARSAAIAIRHGARLRGLGETSCTIDPTTGGRVCTSGPAGASSPVAASSCTSITPRYLPDPTEQQWAWDNPMRANWIFTGRPDVNSVYDMYVRQDGGAYAAVGPGGGFMYNDPRRATVPAYGPCVQPAAALAPAPVNTPTTPAPVIDASSGQPGTIQPVAAASALPSPMATTAAPAYAPSSSVPWGKIALYGGIGIGGLLLLKVLGVLKH
jgi:hypothetical protein